MEVRLHERDLPGDYEPGETLAVDTETMGLHPTRDRLCLVQLSTGDGSADILRIEAGQNSAPNLVAVLEDSAVLKLFHYARFDIAALNKTFDCRTGPVYCTKIASRFARTYTDQHGLKMLAKELLGLDLNKEQQSSDWGADTLTAEQLQYAAADVVYLHALKTALDAMLLREGRVDIAQQCFDFLPVRAKIDLMGWHNRDIFAH
ncbi:MAG: ribonuclease H-like domain-containing protein [Rhodobacteraceae bacterium]|nr:ribonuclease H-like domain-containing protein [Paracoccaceae bacterium]